jgi:type II secretory pathway pseudopilin PulG
MAILRRKGFGLTEVIIIVAILMVLLTVCLVFFYQQLAKGRDGKRKADLAQWQNVLEDYINDAVCYPEGLVCGVIREDSVLKGYITEIPCDPVDNSQYNYLFTYSVGEDCNKWYKIYTKLENEGDPVIAQVGCGNGCGPERHYNYWVGSANVTEVAPLPNEFWPDIPGEPENGGVPSPIPSEPPPTSLPSPTPSPTASPEPLPSIPPEAIPPSSTCLSDGEPTCLFHGCGPGECCGSCCDYNTYTCDEEINMCVPDPLCEGS